MHIKIAMDFINMGFWISEVLGFRLVRDHYSVYFVLILFTHVNVDLFLDLISMRST